MFNLIRMDLHHMFRAKCFWIMMFITTIFLFIAGYALSGRSGQQYSEEELMHMQEKMDAEEFAEWMEPLDISLENMVSTEVVSGKNGQTLLTLVCLFGVLFSMRERKNGFIKNIAGGIRHRWYLWISKVVVMIVYIVITFLLAILCLAISERIFDIGGDMTLGGSFWCVLGIQALLYLILSMFCITIVNLTRSSAVSVLLAFFSSYGLLALLLMLPGELLKIENLKIYYYTAEYQIMKMDGMPVGEAMQTICVLILGGLIFYNLINILVLKKRDVC